MKLETLPALCNGCEHEVSTLLQWLVDFVHELGYFGVFLMTFLESTILPVPSEITMIPVGYLIFQGKMLFWPVLILSVLGTVAGALVNYYFAMRIGRPLLIRFGKYFLLSEKKVDKLDRFFSRHGEISTFTGRLIPGLRHFISLPAGLTRMNIKKFCFYTSLGGGIWMLTLIATGYWIGGNQALLHHYMPWIIRSAIMIVIVIVLLYVYLGRRRVRNYDPHDAV